MIDAARPPRENAGGLIILSVFILSRLVFYLQGGAFVATPLAFAMQYLDPALLKTDLLQSLFLSSLPAASVQPHAGPGAKAVPGSGPVILDSF